ncbi:MAG: SUKH-3 domain-containing protein [Marinisporobacter sp.]|jgi:hypothetical protein|nr:SUKH-3 domain-containing protein [Marinisporobacter sp.]
MVDISLLEKETIEILEKSGWNIGRKIDISHWIEILTDEGYECFPYAIEVLEELGEIEIRQERNKSHNHYSGDIDFHALNAGSGEVDRLEIFESIAGEKLFPLGMVYEQWFLYVGRSRKIYMGSYTEVYLLGSNIAEFLNNTLITGKKPKLL